MSLKFGLFEGLGTRANFVEVKKTPLKLKEIWAIRSPASSLLGERAN